MRMTVQKNLSSISSINGCIGMHMKKKNLLDLSKYTHKEISRLHAQVRKEYVKRNRDKADIEGFEIGNVVKIYHKTKSVKSYWSSLSRHDPEGEVRFGVVTKVVGRRDGFIQNYLIKVYTDDESKEGRDYTSVSRGSRQVEAVTKEEERACRLVHTVKEGGQK